jgi:meso-butanediol dehydrogenase / (S,S)-butanediol dehydrogenase / diacetyl reductase
MRLEGKTALITGGGAGIGCAIAKLFTAEGAKVCITGRRQALLDEVAGALPAESCATCAGDVADFDAAVAMVEKALTLTGRLDILVNNAGIDPAGSVVDIDPALFRRVVETNLVGPFLMMKAAIPHMIKAGGGSIVNISSLAGVRCLPGMPAYCSTKAGLNHLTRQVALDYGADRVRCNVICPGAVRTEMLEVAMQPAAKALDTDLDGVFARMTANSPLHRISTPDEIAKVVLWVASDDSSYMTGSEILVDGGTHVVDANATWLSNAGLKWGGA